MIEEQKSYYVDMLNTIVKRTEEIKKLKEIIQNLEQENTILKEKDKFQNHYLLLYEKSIKELQEVFGYQEVNKIINKYDISV